MPAAMWIVEWRRANGAIEFTAYKSESEALEWIKNAGKKTTAILLGQYLPA